MAMMEAETAWKNAPIHVKAMAGPYVGPLLGAILALEAEMEEMFDHVLGLNMDIMELKGITPQKAAKK